MHLRAQVPEEVVADALIHQRSRQQVLAKRSLEVWLVLQYLVERYKKRKRQRNLIQRNHVLLFTTHTHTRWARIPEVQVRIPSRGMGTFSPHAVSSIFRLSLTHKHAGAHTRTRTRTHTHTHTRTHARTHTHAHTHTHTHTHTQNTCTVKH